MAATDLHEIAYQRVPGARDGHRFVLRVPDDLWVFPDHFPSRPILPAYVQLEAVLRRVQRVWPALRPPCRVPALKFSRAITPGDEVVLSLTRIEAIVELAMAMDGRPCLVGRLEFPPRPGA